MTTRRMPWMRAWHALAIASLTLSCGRTPPSLDRVADGYVRAALQLAQHDPDLVEAWRGDDSLIPGPRVPVASILDDVHALQRSIDALASDVGSADEKTRIDYLDHQLRALDFAGGRLLGKSTSVDDQARQEFGVAFSQVDAEAVKRTLADIDRLLPGRGTPIDRVNALRKRTTIPADRAQAIMTLALDACRNAAAPVIDFPKDESVTIRFHGNMPWDALARDAGGHQTVIELNSGSPLDASRALRLACHEGYTGHHVQHLLLDRAFAQRHWPELQLTPAFGRHLLFAEGSSEVGADLAFTASQRATFYRERLFPAAGLDPRDIDPLVGVEELLPSLLPVVTEVARQYLDTRITQQQAIDRLADEALIGSPQATLAFIERRRARALVYGEGRRVIYSMMPTKDLAGLRALIPVRSAIQ